MKKLLTMFALAGVLSACGGTGAGGATPQPSAPAKTAVPAVAGSEAPKDYGKQTPKPSGSPDDYYGY